MQSEEKRRGSDVRSAGVRPREVLGRLQASGLPKVLLEVPAGVTGSGTLNQDTCVFVVNATNLDVDPSSGYAGPTMPACTLRVSSASATMAWMVTRRSGVS